MLLEFSPLTGIDFASKITNSNSQRLIKIGQNSDLEAIQCQKELHLFRRDSSDISPNFGYNCSYKDMEACESLRRLMNHGKMHAKQAFNVSVFLIDKHEMNIRISVLVPIGADD